MTLEQTIEITKATLEDIERLAKAAAVDQKEAAKDKVAQYASLHAMERASKKLRSVIAGNSDSPVVFSFGDMRASSLYRHSTLGTARAATTEYQYYQTSDAELRRGQRFMDRFKITRIGVNNALRLFYPSTVTGQASLVNEGQAKPLREYTFDVQDFTFQKLAVTDLVTHELTIADTRDKVTDFLTTALVEHVLDSLNRQFINYLENNATSFSALDFVGFLNLPSSAHARWHDLIAAMQIQFSVNFADHILPLKYGNIVLANHRVYWGIQRDRIAPGYAHYGDGGIFERSVLDIEDIMYDKDARGLLLTNTQVVRIEVIDEVQVYFERVAESASERNLYRLTAEVYFRFIPAKLPLPAISSELPLNDLQALQP